MIGKIKEKTKIISDLYILLKIYLIELIYLCTRYIHIKYLFITKISYSIVIIISKMILKYLEMNIEPYVSSNAAFV